MVITEPKHIAWLLPSAYIIHIVDEYFFGVGFSNWFSEMFGAELSVSDFIIINSIGLVVMISIAIFYSKKIVGNFFLAVPGTVLFINGLIHIIASIITWGYSPGTISAIVIYMPLGFLIFIKVYPLIETVQRVMSITAGIILQLVVSIIALNI